MAATEPTPQLLLVLGLHGPGNQVHAIKQAMYICVD